MDTMTITEALAEIKTIGKRISKKRQFVLAHLARQEFRKDPLHREGGSEEALRRERQAIDDLQDRLVLIRRAISRANEANEVAVAGVTRSIADWLRWRREVAPDHQKFLNEMQSTLQGFRQQARTKGLDVVTAGAVPNRDEDVIVNVNEGRLAEQIEEMEKILGDLDGQLSLRNATISIEI